jgi:hypothetical protein
MVIVDDEGELTEQVLATRSYLQGVVALPGERFATASSRAAGAVVSVFETDGALVWEQTYGRETHAEPSGIAYDPTREQIVVPGSYRGADGGRTRTWMITTDLDGNQQWEMTRLPQETKGVDGQVASVSPNRGPELRGVSVGPDGTLVAPGQTSVDLTFFVVGPDACE